MTYVDPTAFPSSTVIVYAAPTPIASSVMVVVVIVSSIFGLLLFALVGIIALLLKNTNSVINDLSSEVSNLLLRGFFLAVLMIVAIINYGDRASDTTSSSFFFFLFLLSRLWVVLLWIILFFAPFLRPADYAAEEEEEGDSSGKVDKKGHHHHRHHRLSKLIQYEVFLSSKFRVTVFSMVAVCGLLDLSILRLLPWLQTEFSEYVGGYPDLFSLRCCVYGSNVSLVLQCIASILLLAKEGQSSSNLALSVISVVLSISLTLKTLMETVSAIQKERSVKMVTVLDLDKHLLRSVSMQTASRESLINKLDEIATLRFSDSEGLCV